MKTILANEQYAISADVLSRVIDLLEPEQCVGVAGDEDNNYAVIEALDLLKAVAGIK